MSVGSSSVGVGTTPPPSSSPVQPQPPDDGIPVVSRVADVFAVEQDCRITVYYGPLHIDENRTFILSAGENRRILGATEVANDGAGASGFRMADPIDYRSRKESDLTYFAMPAELLDDGRQLPLEEPVYHLLGKVRVPIDGSCSVAGRELSFE